MGDELLWPNSMPCWLPENEDDIPLAYYGDSDIGRLKTIYRQGLAHRYGRRMQTIAGIHYNWSLPEEAWIDLTGIEDGKAARDRGYFMTLRGFRRNYWLLLWLFGASPAMDRSFFGETERGNASRLVSGSTSLRMSDLGYQNKAQQTLGICFNALETYAETLSQAVHQPWADYEQYGTLVDGQWQQLSESLLQIENEYYSVIRPKQLQQSGERPVKALRERGVSWLEVRCLDRSLGTRRHQHLDHSFPGLFLVGLRVGREHRGFDRGMRTTRRESTADCYRRAHPWPADLGPRRAD